MFNQWYLPWMITNSSYKTQWALINLFSWICWNWLFSRSPFISAFIAAHSGLSGNTGKFHLNYWWTFSLCQLQDQIDWHASGGTRRIDHPRAEARRICSIERTLPTCCVCPRHGTKILCRQFHFFIYRYTRCLCSIHVISYDVFYDIRE